MSTLQGKTLFITGASRGIGLAIALRAARDGAHIVIAAKTDRPDVKLPGTDVRAEAQVSHAIDQTLAKFGRLDIVVNNASAVQRTPVVDTDMKRFDLMH